MAEQELNEKAKQMHLQFLGMRFVWKRFRNECLSIIPVLLHAAYAPHAQCGGFGS